MKIVERTCDRCAKVQFFAVEYVAPDWDVGITGGWGAELFDPEDEDIDTDWTLAERCRCEFDHVERTRREMAVGRDYTGTYDWP